jgi:phosphotransferase system  glucose/maltose/N-acetylglucosamine-specific IIC component
LRLAEELVDVVSSVGVRINEVLDHGNLESLVQYLPGFGYFIIIIIIIYFTVIYYFTLKMFKRKTHMKSIILLLILR